MSGVVYLAGAVLLSGRFLQYAIRLKYRPVPGLPIRPVAKWQLMMALTLSLPAAAWLTPCE